MTQINNMRNMEETDTLKCWTEHKNLSDERAHAYHESFCEVFSIATDLIHVHNIFMFIK